MPTVTSKLPNDRPAVAVGAAERSAGGDNSYVAPGTVIADRYEIVQMLAKGGMGAVYAVIDRSTRRRRALKLMHAWLLQDDEMRERFERESRLPANIESDFIVDVFNTGVEKATGRPFLVMELLRGESLQTRLEREGRLAPEEVVTHLYQASLALDKTHQSHIVHRDLKPDNLFVTEVDDGQRRVIKVLDFGIAKVLQAAGARQKSTRNAIGTPGFMAPEQFMLKGICPATDVFAIGMMAYILLTGRSYWAAEIEEGQNVLIGSVIAGPRTPASTRAKWVGQSLPSAFDGWFARATAFNPQDRFAKASDAVIALADALGVAHPRSSSLPGATQVLYGHSTPTALGEHPRSSSLPGATRGSVPSSRSQGARQAGVIAALLLLVLSGGFFVIKTLIWSETSGPKTTDTTAAPTSSVPLSAPILVTPPPSVEPEPSTPPSVASGLVDKGSAKPQATSGTPQRAGGRPTPAATTAKPPRPPSTGGVRPSIE